MKNVICHLSLVIGLALVAPVQAQRSVVVNTNGLLTAPTNFWTANSNAINTIVAGGGSGAAWISTNARTSATNLGLGWLPLTNTNAANFRSAIGLGASWLLNTNAPITNLPSWLDNDFAVTKTNIGLGADAQPQYYGLNITTNAASGLQTVIEPGKITLLNVPGGAAMLLDTNGITFLSNAAAITRTNLRLPWSGLTNTNAAGFRSALNLSAWTTNTNAPIFPGTNGVATAPAWYLGAAPTNGVPTITTNQVGMGWDELGRFTVQTPVMALSFYATGDPSSPTIYIPGTVVVNRLSSVFLDTQVYASNIVGGVSGGVLADSIMRDSMPSVLRNFMGGDTAAGQAGVPYILTNASMQPVPGNYFPYARVITNASSVLELEGQWLNSTNMRATLGAEIAATNVTVTNAVTLPAARRVIATIDSGLAGSSNTITLQTNAATHGDYAEVRYVRTADNATVNVVDPFVPATNAVMSTRSMFWSYSTNVSPARWVPVGRTIGADVVLGTLATNNSVPSGSAPTNFIMRPDGAGFSSFVSDGVFVARQLTNSATITNPTSEFGDLRITNLPAGLYSVQGYMSRSNVGGGVQYRVNTTNQVLPARNMLGWNSAPSAFYNTATSYLNDGDANTGTRDWSIMGLLLFTNTGTVSFYPHNVGAVTNTTAILSNSFLILIRR